MDDCDKTATHVATDTAGVRDVWLCALHARSHAKLVGRISPVEPVAKTGRPTRGDAAARPLTIRVTDDERALWTTAAGEQSLSEWARNTLTRAAKRQR